VQVLVALTVGLVIWIVLWALGVKSFDAFMITILLVVTAATARLVEPFIRERMRP
jgi:predicted PurR-regulated permease PerM